jgi:uncharacterized protein (DUF488 family)
VEIYTIGFTRKSAAQFFGLLKQHGIRRLVDVRLNNVSQLAGFSKRDDLAYFLREIVGAEYLHEPLLAPTQEMLDDLSAGCGRYRRAATARWSWSTVRRMAAGPRFLIWFA